MSEQELRQTIAALDGSRAQLDNLMKQRQLISASIEEHVRAMETLKGYSAGQEGESILVPVGADIFLHARAADWQKGIMSIGGDVLMERPIAEISDIVEQRLTELRKASDELGAQAERLTATIESLTRQAQMQYSDLQGRPSRRDRENTE